MELALRTVPGIQVDDRHYYSSGESETRKQCLSGRSCSDEGQRTQTHRKADKTVSQGKEPDVDVV